MVRKRENIQWAAVVWTKMPCWCQRRMGRLVRDDRKATVTQITTSYNQGMQNTISEHTTRRTLKQMGYSSRRPHRVPLLSAKNRKRRLQFTQVHQNWTIEDWKNVAWFDESRFLLRHSDGRVRIWLKEHESMDPSCLVSTVQWCNGVGDIFLANFGHLSTNWASFKRHSLPEYCCWPCPSWPLRFLAIMQRFSIHILNPIEHLWDVVEREIHIMDVQLINLQQLRDAIMSIWTKISEECFQLVHSWIYATKN